MTNPAPSVDEALKNYMGERFNSTDVVAIAARLAFEAGYIALQTELRKRIDQTDLPRASHEDLQKMLILAWEVDNDNQEYLKNYASMESEIAALKAENEKLQSKLDRCTSAGAYTVSNFKAELAEARKDSERLEWLIKNETFVKETLNGNYSIYQANNLKRIIPVDSHREAIDAAMSAGSEIGQ